MERTTDGSFEVITAGPASRFENNIYIVIDRATGAAAFIDAPDEPEKAIAAAEAVGASPSVILLTHGHMDHTAGIDALKEHFGCALYAAVGETGLNDGQIDTPVTHGDEVRIGGFTFQVLSVPGHTPGSTTYVYGKHAFVGDTLFPGGPGHSRTPEALQQEIESITTHLYALPDDTVIYPGHGAKCTIGESKAEYAVFAGKQHANDLHGDVNWMES